MDREVRLGTVALPGTSTGRSGPRALWRRHRELRAARRVADAELLASDHRLPHLDWRVAEITAVKNRLGVADGVRKLIRAADVRYLPGATPLNRLAVRDETETLRLLEHRLRELDRPVTARGVLLLDRLLTDGYGPLYVSYRAGELRWALAEIVERLTPR